MYGNANVSEIVYTQQVSYDGETDSAATLATTTAVSLFATTDCWIARGAAPTAAATPGAVNIPIPANTLISIPITGGFKISAIKASTAGVLNIYEHSDIHP